MTGLGEELASVDWARNVADCRGAGDLIRRLETGLATVSAWAKGLVAQYSNDEGGSFLSESVAQGHYACAQISLGLVKSSAASMRALVESALCFTYFSSHPKEFRTLVAGSGYYVEKGVIVDFHRQHTPSFADRDKRVGFISELNSFYSEASQLIHAQVPGRFVTHAALGDIGFDLETCKAGVSLFERAVRCFNRMLACWVEVDVWRAFAPDCRREIGSAFLPCPPGELGLTEI